MQNLENREFNATSGVANISSHSSRTNVFICCSRNPKDHECSQELKKFLKPDIRSGKIHIWDDDSVVAGSHLQEEAERAMQSARVIVLLISVNFFASDHIMEYIVPQVFTVHREKSTRIINVILGASDFEHSELAQFLAVNNRPLTRMSQAEQDTLWIQVVESIRETIVAQSEPTFERFFGQPNTLQTVTSLFSKCRSMQTQQSRQQVLQQVPEEMRQSIEVSQFKPQHSEKSDFEEVHDLVTIYAAYPDGLEKLAYALYKVEHASLPWQALDTYLCQSGKKLVTYTRRQELYDILNSAQWPDYLFRRAYRNSIPDSWSTRRNYNVSNVLSLILAELAEIPAQNNDTFPLLEFAQRLAFEARDREKDSLHDELRNWITHRSKALGLTESQQVALREKATQRRQPTPFYLLLTLDEASDKAFTVQCWLLDDENNSVQNADIEVPDQLYSLDDIPNLLDGILEQCENCLLDEMANLVIEFFLPLELLSYPVDQYTIRGFSSRQSLSSYYQVVVRSLERMKRNKQRNKQGYIWKNKWKIFQDCSSEEQDLSKKHNATLIYDKEQYQELEDLAAILRGDSIACLALTFVPSNSSSQTDDVLRAVLEAGIPIALWAREQTDYPQVLPEFLPEFVSQHPLSQLPALVKQQRYDAIKSGQKQRHQGHYLTLLWDDPERIPPTRQLAAPSVSKGA
ncbi:hypothetical protein KDW_38910 [Dictyobacter vulcani]|uniref:Uncharacterized protein n=1 Tax=Dictyobacter vulcani TaxID=2607529 RepID=A0A5J4KUI6_9CHLR|nr:TIR domain-containing protein [Dictyobacter vulcani]GER89729.1 hypothetical protein KDW_38910 [Dictyobacter vulcani]